MDKFCQCCGMPMVEDKDFGTNSDGTKNEDYCVYCYENGGFIYDCTMEEQIEENLKHLAEFNAQIGVTFTEADARKGMQEFFPTLKRWQK